MKRARSLNIVGIGHETLLRTALFTVIQGLCRVETVLQPTCYRNSIAFRASPRLERSSIDFGILGCVL